MAASKARGLFWLVGVLLFTAAIVVGLPLCAAHVPWSVEERLGRATEVALSDRMKTCRTLRPGGQDALERLVGRLYPLLPGDSNFPLTVAIVRSETVNAFATLGGRVFLLSGLIEKTESPEELAGVLAHEMEHVKRRHILQGVFVGLLTAGLLQVIVGDVQSAVGSLAQQLVTMKFSRDQESEADRGGLSRLFAARIGTEGFSRFFERLEKSELVPAVLSDHPASEKRAELARSFAGGATEPILRPGEDWKSLRAACPR